MLVKCLNLKNSSLIVRFWNSLRSFNILDTIWNFPYAVYRSGHVYAEYKKIMKILYSSGNNMVYWNVLRSEIFFGKTLIFIHASKYYYNLLQKSFWAWGKYLERYSQSHNWSQKTLKFMVFYIKRLDFIQKILLAWNLLMVKKI